MFFTKIGKENNTFVV